MLCKLLSALFRQGLTSQLNHLASLAKWFSVPLQTGCGFESYCCQLHLLIQKLLKYIKLDNADDATGAELAIVVFLMQVY